MENRYDDKVLQFFNSAAGVVHYSSKKTEFIYDTLKTMSLHPDWFTTKGDYRAYYAFLAAYHALVDYYEYRAVYNKKDEKLENALRDWYKAIQPKQNIFARISSYVKSK